MSKPVARSVGAVRRVFEAWLLALRHKDVGAMMSHYAPDVVFFDAVPPLQVSADEYRQNWERYLFEWYPGTVEFETSDVHVTAGDTAAFARAFVQHVTTDEAGKKESFWIRLTVGYERRGGKWRIAHEHWSTPVDVDTGKAALHLVPVERNGRSGMTADGFRRIALGLDRAIEKAHHGHPDFRVEGRIFATLGYPDTKHGMVNLTPDQQRSWVRQHPAAFLPVKGSWGEQGSTTVRLDAVDEEVLGEALSLAWQNAVNSVRGSSKKTRKTAKAARTARR
jgi:uncharacterized protein (TIGR02246 family)